MKKKVLSVLLAAALFAGSAVAVNAQVWGEWPVSSQSGMDEDVASLVFDATSYTVENGQSIDLKEKLIAYTKDGKSIVQEPTLEWEITDNDLAIGLNDGDEAGKVYAYENKGTATVTVIANDGKVKASVKVTATPLKKATGYKFEKTSYTARVGGDPGIDSTTEGYFVGEDVKIVATPEGSHFSDAQVKALRYDAQLNLWYHDTASAANITPVAFKFKEIADDNKSIVFEMGPIDKQAYTYKANSKNAYDASAEYVISGLADKAAKVTFPDYDGTKNPKDVTPRTVRASTVKAVDAMRAGRSGAITVEVGKTVDLGDYVKYGPTGQNVDKDQMGTSAAWLLGSWGIEYYNDNYEIDDYAVLKEDGSKIMAVSVGKIKATNVFTNSKGETYPIEIPINVVAKGAGTTTPDTTITLSQTSASLAVGQNAWIEAKNVPADKEVVWTFEDNGIVSVVSATNNAKIFAKNVGTAKVVASVDGTEVGTVTVTVTAQGTTVTPPPTTVVPNPSTGDSLFANLF